MPKPDWLPADVEWPPPEDPRFIELDEFPQPDFDNRGLLVPVAWLEWTDQQRYDYVRDQIRSYGRHPGPHAAASAAVWRVLRHRLLSRLRYQRQSETVSGQARAYFLVSQDGKCASCGDLLDGVGQLDHDHGCCPGPAATACGECYRALLCVNCNTGIGLFHEDPSRLRKAAEYVDRIQVP